MKAVWKAIINQHMSKPFTQLYEGIVLIQERHVLILHRNIYKVAIHMLSITCSKKQVLEEH